jgi:ribosome-associated heat shock protein Hsp15
LKDKSSEIRVDTYLWAIRIFKSRSLASTAIKAGKVKLNEENVKASHVVKIGERYTISYSGGAKKIIEVSALLEKRQSFEIARQHYIDHSPVIEKTEKEDAAFFKMNIETEKGSGRPTKRDRRKLGKDGGWF